MGRRSPCIVSVWRAVASTGLHVANFSERRQAVCAGMPEHAGSLMPRPQCHRRQTSRDREGCRGSWGQRGQNLQSPCWDHERWSPEPTKEPCVFWVCGRGQVPLDVVTPVPLLTVHPGIAGQCLLTQCPIHALYPETSTHCTEERLKGISPTIAEHTLKGEFQDEK